MRNKSIFIVLILFFSGYSFPQNKFLAGASFNLGFPTGEFSDIAKTGLGGSIIAEYMLDPNISVTLSAAYQNFPGNFGNVAVQGVVIDVSFNSIPVLAGMRYYFNESVFGTIEAGAHFFRVNADISDVYNSEKFSTDYEAKFGGGFGAGFRFKLAEASVFEVSSVYQIVEDDLNSVALRFGILVLLDKI